MADLHFELVTPEKLLRSEDVQMVVVPGTRGRFRRHGRPRALYVDPARRRDRHLPDLPGGEPERIAVQGGFAEVSDKGLTVLAESAEG